MSRRPAAGSPRGAPRVLSATVCPPHTSLPWSPAALDAGLHAALAALAGTAAQWREAFENVDEGVHAEVASAAPKTAAVSARKR
ncbi:hypothetical protein [Kitasatospora sp. NPDC059327]|uniref:hypothetical protein n=1 Tax=Kitasatospora sp. NPDC059327 TaxID=3346803 RepID=UPI0036803D41